ncbi:hypothetical protein COU88_00335, partial [Candidatus Roizmanbacteria bacterium CG10_big_fil_rev_8_21_14_0_10_39_6]
MRIIEPLPNCFWISSIAIFIAAIFGLFCSVMPYRLSHRNKKTRDYIRHLRYTIHMHIFIVDTNFFINLQRPLGLGSSKEEVVDSLIKKSETAVQKHELELLTTPASFDELVGFFENQEDIKKKLL